MINNELLRVGDGGAVESRGAGVHGPTSSNDTGRPRYAAASIRMGINVPV
jgi:hypothetical protein